MARGGQTAPVPPVFTPAGLVLETFFTDSYVSLPGSAIWVTVPSSFTVEAWIRMADFRDYETIIGMGINGDEFGFYHYKTSFFSPGGFTITQSGGGGGDVAASSPGVVPIDTWTHVAIACVGLAGTFSTYVNGAPDRLNQPLLRAVTPSIAGSDRFLCGDGIGEEQQGRASDIRIWNIARSAAAISSDYDRRLTGSEPGLLGYWRLDDGPLLGTTAADSTVNAATGTLHSLGGIHCNFVADADGPLFRP